MLKKSKATILIMGFIYALTAILTLIVLANVSEPETPPYNALPAVRFAAEARLVAWALLVVTTVLIGWISSIVIGWFDESHFGVDGAIRWAFAGFFLALWLDSAKWLLFVFDAPEPNLSVSLLAVVLGFLVSYHLAFRLIPAAKALP